MSLTTVTDPAAFMRSLLLNGVQRVIQEISEEEIKTAKANVERRVREKVGEIAASTVSELSFERFGQDLRITVRFPQEKAP